MKGVRRTRGLARRRSSSSSTFFECFEDTGVKSRLPQSPLPAEFPETARSATSLLFVLAPNSPMDAVRSAVSDVFRDLPGGWPVVCIGGIVVGKDAPEGIYICCETLRRS